MALHPRELKLGEALVRLKVIDELQLASALASADQWPSTPGSLPALAEAAPAADSADELRARISRVSRGGA